MYNSADIATSNRPDPEGSFHYNKFSEIPKNGLADCEIRRQIGKDKNGKEVPHVNIRFLTLDGTKICAEVCYLASCPYIR